MKKTLALLLAVLMVVCVFAGCQNDDEKADATYTYNQAWSVFPTLWNPHTYETATSADVMAYLEDGFYSFDYNEDMTGFQMVPAMTTDEHPVDITADYVGKYGIEEGDANLVYKINLRNDLYWETGEKITANDFVESAKRLLNPAAQNYRADTLYSGDVVIFNAENYLKQGMSEKKVNSANGETYTYNMSDLVLGEDGTYETVEGYKAYFGLEAGYAWMGGYSLTDYSGYIPESVWTGLTALADENGYVAITDEAIDLLYTFTGSDVWGNESQDDLAYYVSYDFTYSDVAWEDVGIFALSDTELVYVLTTPMEGFYLKYGLPSGYLVHIATYDKCESIVDGIYSNNYGTSAETTVSYGPYKLVEYQTDKVFKFEKNEYYYDLSDTTYQTTNIEIQRVEEASTRLSMLINGELDTYGLTVDDFEKYGQSDFCYYAKGANTWGMVFNPGLDQLTTSQEAAGANINKTILTIPEFRQAMAYGIDRSAFILATSPSGAPAFGLLTELHIVDPDTGVGYRTTDIAKDVLAKFWGVADDIGEGKLYANVDEAIDSLTGYNPELAKQKFEEAYDIAIADGLMDADDTIQICIGLPSAESTTYNNGYEFIVNGYTELVKGTKLEGKLTFTRDDTLGDNFAGALQSNQVDMLFYVGWSGEELNPYDLMGAYVESAYQYDSNFDYTTTDLTIELDGTEWTTSVYNWYEIMNGIPHTIFAADGTSKEYSCGTADGDKETRLQLLGELEGAVLMNYNFIPLSGNATAQLKGAQIKYYTEDYIWGMGFGGIKYMTYNYTDAEWDAYVASMNGELDYT